MKPLRAFLFSCGPSGEWSSSAFRELEPLLEATKAALATESASAANVHGLGQVVKRLRLNGKKIVLESANPDYVSIEVDNPSEISVQGVVVGRAGKM